MYKLHVIRDIEDIKVLETRKLWENVDKLQEMDDLIMN